MGGILLYAIATLLYLYLLSRYKFTIVQSLAIPLSLIFSIFVATTFFNDSLSVLNYTGLLAVLIGVLLITLG